MAWNGIDPGDWARETKEKLDAIFRASVQGMANEMSKSVNKGGHVPVKTGNLARSLLAQKGSMPMRGESGEKYAGVDIGPLLLDIEAGDKVYLGYQAIYAHRLNYGFVGEDSLGRTYNQAGLGFAEKAAAKWKQIVDKVVIDARVKGGSLSSTSIGRGR